MFLTLLCELSTWKDQPLFFTDKKIVLDPDRMFIFICAFAGNNIIEYQKKKYFSQTYIAVGWFVGLSKIISCKKGGNLHFHAPIAAFVISFR